LEIYSDASSAAPDSRFASQANRHQALGREIVQF
jgi:hypothetical protein